MKILCFILILIIPLLSVAQSPVPSGAKLDTIVSGLAQLEGPVWKDGLGLLFSDIARSRIYLWSPSDNSTTVYLSPSDSSNGLTFDAQGLLILTQMQKRRVSRQELNGTITPLASTFRGKKFNSPNDLVIKSDGSIFFTDPDFNIPGGSSKKELTFQGVYRISPSGNVTLLDSTFDKPNGICFSPKETKLYVNESPQGKIYVWDVINDSTIDHKTLFYQVPISGYVDGMKTDSAGNVYCTGPTGVWIISPEGTYLDKIATPRNPSNCTWGDADKKTLYITTGNATNGTGFVYRIRLASSTGIENHGSILPYEFNLYQNYPNPFNPITRIRFQIALQGRIKIEIFDISGKNITTVVDEDKSPGMYEYSWNAIGYSSGTYFCKLTTSRSVITEKILLLK